MASPNFELLKKGKSIPKYYGFHIFADPGYPILVNGPFRDNIRVFIEQCAELEDYRVEGMSIWCTFLVHEKGGFVIPLYTIEQDVKYSLEPFCDHCRCAGWSHHFVSRRKYHMIIPVDEEWKKPLGADILDLETHLLHGLIHCNGFGHLLCINGIEGGSKKLCGREIMDLWDRICSCLHASKITVQDASNKHRMDLRLLHGVAYGHSWFGRWGYRFFRGSFGVKDHHYDSALELLSSLELDKVIQDFSYTERWKEVKHIICCYREVSKTNLITVRDLLRFMLTLNFRAEGRRRNAAKYSNSKVRFGPVKSMSRVVLPVKSFREEKSGKCRKFSTIALNWDSRWPVKRLEFTAHVIVEALKMKQMENNFRGSLMNRQEVRDAARQQIGDTGLIDYVLKSLNNVVVGDCIVRRMVNKTTRKLEYMIEEVNKSSKYVIAKIPQMSLSYPAVHGDDIYTDVSYLYTNVLLGYPESEMVKVAARTILNSKYFAKEWPFRDEQDHTLRFICRLLPSVTEMETELTREFPRGEYIVVPLHSTIGDLKVEIQNAMRDTYCIMEHFVVTDIAETEGMEDDELLFGLLESGLELWVRGVGLDLDSDLSYEGGADNWKVRCKCGAQDDDGERMLACDMCEIWQHTYCCGIKDSEATPRVFMCDACYSTLGLSMVAQPIHELEPCGALVPSMESEIYYPDSCLLSLDSTAAF